SGAAMTRNPMFLFFPVMMVASVVGTMVYGARGGATRSAEIDENRRTYLRYLDAFDADLATMAVDRHAERHARHPCPESLWAAAGGPRMWSCRPEDDDFGCVRVGVGAARIPLCEPDIDDEHEQDPVTVSAVRSLVRRRAVLAG